VRGHAPEGKSRDASRKARDARFINPVKSHSVENIGKADCRLLILEEK
jgi:oxalate decarboxylase/phosphoglucose isomerase-like protein (cupin superfamily)